MECIAASRYRLLIKYLNHFQFFGKGELSGGQWSEGSVSKELDTGTYGLHFNQTLLGLGHSLSNAQIMTLILQENHWDSVQQMTLLVIAACL